MDESAGWLQEKECRQTHPRTAVAISFRDLGDPGVLQITCSAGDVNHLLRFSMRPGTS